MAIQHPMGAKFIILAIRYPVGSESKSEILFPMGKELGKDGERRNVDKRNKQNYTDDDGVKGVY